MQHSMIKKTVRFLQANKLFLLVILLAATLRFILPNTPPSLNWDEISHGYNAYSILKTGKDEWGKLFPIIFRAYGDYKLPLYIYLTSFFEFLFGLSVFAVRLPSILAGVGTVVFTYLLTRHIFKSSAKAKNIALLASLLVSVEPWSFFVSRAAFEANLALFLFVAGMYCFARFKSSKQGNFLLFSVILFGLTGWTYNSYRIFTPLMMMVAVVLFWKNLKDLYRKFPRTVYVSLFFVALFFLPMFFQLFTSVGQARYSWVQILDQGTIARIDEARGVGGSRIVHNKLTYFLVDFSKNYVSHFTPNFLFFRGGSNYQFSVPGHGLLYLTDIPFLLFGLFFLFKGVLKKEKWAYLLFFWLFFAPIPSSLTREAPHVLRAITFIPVPMIISAFGLSEVLSYVTGKTSTFLFLMYFLLLFMLSFSYFRNYFGSYRVNYSQAWQYGYRQVSEFIGEHYSNYDKIVISKKYGEPHEFLLFYLKWPPQEYLSDPNLNRFFQTNWYWVDGFDKFYFVNDWQIKLETNGNYTFKQESGGLVQCTPKVYKCLLVTSPDNVPDGWKLVKHVDFLNGRIAFELYEN
jgi:4-amino-4-deoxy-L-arabinose transferase-like glycosyltransferase